MRLVVVTMMKDRKEANKDRMKIWVGYIVIENIRDMEENTSERRSRRARKEVVDCVQAVVGKKNFQF